MSNKESYHAIAKAADVATKQFEKMARDMVKQLKMAHFDHIHISFPYMPNNEKYETVDDSYPLSREDFAQTWDWD